ncbi:MAG: efflux RND transporter periplasmic adaptor subunit [Nitrospirae bacterium]|nr:efflux RND transporter periplasmic adaptor subunit [Nitrospirota bacterium]
METKTMIAFVSGVLLTLVVMAGSWLYFPAAQGKETMEPMPGMSTDETTMKNGKGQSGPAQTQVMIPPERRQRIGVKTGIVEEKSLENVIRTVGNVDYDERRIRQIHLRVPGWITDLSADYTGKAVQKGDPLLALYSPDLVSTQEEYLLAQRTLERVRVSPVPHIRTGAEAQVESARNRLLLWNLTETQIADLERRQAPQTSMILYSPVNGVITKKSALQGMYVTPETPLYEISDLSHVWVHAEIYEYEVAQVRVGQEAAVTLMSYPGETFQGRVTYIYPYLNPETRTVGIRMEFSNPDGKLKPGMYGNVEIRGKMGKKLVVPAEAVLDSGTRQMVFIDKGEGMYEPREVKLGNKVNLFYPVLSGLASGEKVVTSATFLIDSESKLMAAANMMGMVGMGGIRMEQAQMGAMDSMAGMEMEEKPSTPEKSVNGLTLTLATQPEPPAKGKNLLRLKVRSKEGPVVDAAVTVAYTMTMPGMEVETVQAKHTGEGTYTAPVDLAMKGAWRIDVTIARGKDRLVAAQFIIQVK